MQTHVEIEERSLVNEIQYKRVLSHLKTLGDVHTSKRVMINYTAMDYERNESVELRLNDGKLTKVVKKGSFGGTTTEKTTTKDVPLHDALREMAEDGYTHAKISIRIRHVVSRDGLEYCLRDILRYTDPSLRAYPALFEIESESESVEAESTVRKQLVSIMEGLGLTVASTQEFKAWSEFNHTQVDGDFLFSSESARELEAKLHSIGYLK